MATAKNIHEHLPLDGRALRFGPNGKPRLIGMECKNCGARAFPPSSVCPECMVLKGGLSTSVLGEIEDGPVESYAFTPVPD